MLIEKTLCELDRYADFCRRAAAFDGTARERIVAIGEADEFFFRLYPHHYRALQVIRVASQLGSAGRQRIDLVRRTENRAVSTLMSVVRDGVEAGDFETDMKERPQELAFALWAIVFGARALMDTRIAIRQLGIEDGFRVTRDAVCLMLDAVGFLPLSGDWDYEKTRERVRTEVFAEEWRRLNAA